MVKLHSETACVSVEQVANLNPKDNTYSLKDFIYRDVQRDWPGYSEEEKTQVDRILARYWKGFIFFGKFLNYFHK